jgi:hypothetical protein
MRYQDITCGLQVTLQDGTRGKVVAYDGDLVLPFSGGGFQRRSRRGLKARVRTANGQERNVLISSLKKAK